MRSTLLFLFAGSLAAQSLPVNRFTFSGAWHREVGGDSFTEKQTAAGLGLSYGRRVYRFVEAEVGVFTAFQPAPEVRGANYSWDPDDRYLWVPFGLRFVAPLYLGRLEFSGGGGGLYEKYSVSNPNAGFGLQSRHGWGGYFVASAAVALDRGKHLWLGLAPRVFLANPSYTRDRWFQLAGEFSLRF